MNKALVQILAVACALLMPVVAALAQTIGDDIIRKTDLTPQDRQAIKAFADGHKPGLSGTPAEIKKSREELTKPVERPGVSVQFRLALAGELVDKLKTLSGDKDRDIVAVNALHLAGELATSNTLPILTAGLKDPREGVRYAATHGFARMFSQADRFAPAINGEEGSKALRDLADVLLNDKSIKVVDGATIGMMEARAFMKATGVQRLAEAAGKKAIALAKGAEPVDLTAVLRTAGALRNELADPQKLTPDSIKAAAEFGGRALVLISAQLKAGGDRTALIQGAKANISVVSLASSALSGPTIDDHIAKLLEAGKDAEFEKAVEALVGPQGPLVNSPFNIKPENFKP